MYNLGKLQLQPPAPLLLSLQTASQQALSQLPPAGIVMLGQSLHLLHIKQPSSSWQYSYMQAVGNVLPDCTARELAVLTVPLLKWRCVLPEQWMQQYLEACEGCLSQMTAQVCGRQLSPRFAVLDVNCSKSLAVSSWNPGVVAGTVHCDCQ